MVHVKGPSFIALNTIGETLKMLDKLKIASLVDSKVI